MAVGLSTRSYAGSKPARCSSRSSSRASSSESSAINTRSEEHTSELQSQSNLVCRLLLEKKKDHRARRQPPIHPVMSRQQFYPLTTAPHQRLNTCIQICRAKRDSHSSSLLAARCLALSCT